MRAPRRLHIVCILLLILNLMFIWGNSLLEGSKSSQLSKSIVALDSSVQDKGIDEVKAMRRMVRKSAHLAEFACLGVLMTWGCSMAGLDGISLRILPVLGGLTAACIDETIQMFVPGRSSELMDVCLDTVGALIGMMLFWIGHHVWKKNKYE